MTNQKNDRIIGIDMARVIACVAVVGLHTVYFEASHVNTLLYYLCGFAVPFFFMCSGYMLIGRKTTPEYSLHKCAALLLLQIKWGVVVYCVRYLYNLLIVGSTDSFSIARCLAEILKSGFQRGVCWHFWFLTALIIIYLLLPIINHIVCAQETAMGMHLFILWGIFAIISIIIQFVSYANSIPIQASVSQPLRIWTWLQYFLLGGIYKNNSEVITKIQAHKYRYLIFACFVMICILQAYVGKAILNNRYAEYFYDSPLMIIGVFGLFSCIQEIRITAERMPLVRRLSSYTLGVYIIHPLLINIISRCIPADYWGGIGHLAYWFLLTCSCFAITHLVYSRGPSKLLSLK